MTPSRQVAVTALAALFGLAAAVALAVVLSGVTAQHVALTGQPLHEGDRLAVARPRATREAARPRRPAASPDHRRPPSASSPPTATATPPPPTATATAPPPTTTVTAPPPTTTTAPRPPAGDDRAAGARSGPERDGGSGDD